MPSDPERDTHAVLLEKARDLLLDEGLGGFSLRKVAAACDLSAPAIYRHFADKDALLAAAIRKGADLFTACLLGALKAPTPIERLRSLGLRYFAFAMEHPRDYELMFMVRCKVLGNKALGGDTAEREDTSFRLLVDRVAECQRSGDVVEGPPEQIALSIWSGVHGVVSLSLSGHLGLEGAALRELFVAHQERLLKGLAPARS